MELKPNATTEFTNVVESKILPVLRQYWIGHGFPEFHQAARRSYR
jgi:hypothetical protein